MSLDTSLESASLAQLQQTPIDNVMQIIDDGLVHLPTYRELYYRWERQQWQSQEIDFSADRQQWEQMSQEERDGNIGSFAGFFVGEACVTDTLAPCVTAMPDEEMRIFLTTQLVDEARHTVFFERFFTEALSFTHGSLTDTLKFLQPQMGQPFQSLLVDGLTDVAERIRQEPGRLSHLVEGVTLYHIMVEATVALSSQHTMLTYSRQFNTFPAFRAGFTAVARDESRHVIFGVKFLRDMIQRDAANAQIVADTLTKFGPVAIDVIKPAEEQIPYVLALGQDPWITERYAAESLRKKLRVIGLNMNLDWLAVPPPPA